MSVCVCGRRKIKNFFVYHSSIKEKFTPCVIASMRLSGYDDDDDFKFLFNSLFLSTNVFLFSHFAIKHNRRIDSKDTDNANASV